MSIKDMFTKAAEKNTTFRNFHYAKKDTQLAFSLRVDVKHQLRDFKELLLAALKDVEEELSKQK